MTEHFLQSYQLGENGSKALAPDLVAKGLKEDGLAWVHLDATSKASRQWLSSEIAYLDPFIISALLADETRPRATEIGDGVLIILRGVNTNEGQEDEDMVAIRLYVDASRIISMERRQVRAIREIAETSRKGNGPKTSGEFIRLLSQKLTRRADVSVAAIDDQMDETEATAITDEDEDVRHAVSSIRRKAIKLRRHLAPQRDALFELKSSTLPWFSANDRRGIHESYNQTVRAVEELDAVRERAQIIKDEISNRMSEKLNKNTYVLSLIAAIFLPLGFLTGLFGINIGGLPGLESGNAFWIFVVSMLILVATQIIVFRKMKWF